MPLTFNAEQQAQLHRAKRRPLLLLVAVLVVFALATWWHSLDFAQTPQWQLWLRCLQAMCEAAIVGALADWFAVAALFQRIPLPGLAQHTNIVARNKDRIGENLSVFVRDKFLDAPSLITMIRRHDPADMLAQWLTSPSNSGLLGQQVARLMSTALDTVEDDKIQQFISQALRSLLGQLDLSRTMGAALGALTHDRRHQVLLDDLIARLGVLLQSEDTRTFIADTLVQWIKREHPLKEKVLPTDWLGGKGASAIAHAVDTLLKSVADDPHHQLRENLDETIARLIDRLKNDPDWARRGEEIRGYLQNDEKVGAYVRDLWESLKRKLHADLHDAHSVIASRVAEMGKWLGMALAGDAALRVRLNVRLELWAAQWAPDLAQSVAEHIRATVQRWDAQEMAQLVELNIGKDLQYIRINGTLVGGVVGLLLFVLSHPLDIWRALAP